MPIHIYCDFEENNPYDNVEDIGADDWELPSQVEKLEQWLALHRKKLTKGSCVADIGFTLREGACGGGAVMSKKLIAMLHEVGMEVYFSEYWLV